MILPINNPLSVSPLETVSGRKQAREVAAVSCAVCEAVSTETRSVAPNGQPVATAHFGDVRGLTGTDLRFRVGDNFDDIVVVVVERRTGDVIREIPVKGPLLCRATLDAIQSGQGIHVIA